MFSLFVHMVRAQNLAGMVRIAHPNTNTHLLTLFLDYCFDSKWIVDLNSLLLMSAPRKFALERPREDLQDSTVKYHTIILHRPVQNKAKQQRNEHREIGMPPVDKNKAKSPAIQL